jgi:hypothetical protein
MKPKICKLWPFRITSNEPYGDQQKSEYLFNNKRFYVYIDPDCAGISWGNPTWELTNKTIPEFIELSLGMINRQDHSTSRLSTFVEPELLSILSNR